MKILSLQGGGVLGKGQAVALRELELDAPAGAAPLPLWRRFGLVGGTSVGALIGAAVAIGLPMKAVNDFFDVSAPKIFGGSPVGPWWNTFTQLWSSKYSAAALEAALQELFGGHTLADCRTKFICTAFDAASGRNVYFQNYGASRYSAEEIVFGADSPMMNFPLWQICRASAAAQTYFPALNLGTMTLIDGGNTGNNAPDMLCLTEALANGAALADISMLSIGSGKTKWDVSGMSNPSVLRAALATIRIVFAGGESNAVWQAAGLLGKNHCRLESDLGNGFAIDDARPATLDALELAMETAIARNLELIRPFLT